MDVSKQTKLTRLKCLKAFLSRCFDNGWIERKFWRSINIKVDNIVKEGAAERDIKVWILLDSERNLIKEWNLVLFSDLKVQGFKEIISDDDFNYEGEIWFIGELN